MLKIQETCNQKKELLITSKKVLYSEEDVKVKIIIPVLLSMGYDPCLDLYFESSNNSGRADISVEWENHSFILEAKKLNKVLTVKDEHQLFSYMESTQSSFGILTNGKDWQFYNNKQSNPIKVINLEFGLYGDDLEFLTNFCKTSFNDEYLLNYNE